MRLPIIAFASAIALASAAQAKDVTIILNDQEQQAFVQVMDAATRAGGLAATQGTIYFYNKLQTAIAAANTPAKPAEPVADKPHDYVMPATPAPNVSIPAPAAPAQPQ